MCLRLLPTFRVRENRFFLYSTKLNSNFQLNVSIKIILNSLKISELFSETLFQIKINKSGRCHYLEPGRFSRQPLMFRLNFNIISLFFLHRALYKIHMWKLFVYGKIFAHGKTKSGRKSLVKKTKKKTNKNKNRRKEERKSTILSRKGKNPL